MRGEAGMLGGDASGYICVYCGRYVARGSYHICSKESKVRLFGVWSDNLNSWMVQSDTGVVFNTYLEALAEAQAKAARDASKMDWRARCFEEWWEECRTLTSTPVG